MSVMFGAEPPIRSSQSTEQLLNGFTTITFHDSSTYDGSISFSNAEDEVAKYEKNQKQIVQQYMEDILSVILQDEFIDGEISKSAIYINKAYSNDEIEYVKTALMQLYTQNTRNAKILEGIMVMISSVSYDIIEPQGPIMALGLLQHKDLAIRDRAIQCYEQWNSKKGLEALKSLDCHPKWLQQYVEKIIMYIESDGM